ncbi:MAG TPA: hypothetical protein P5244_09895 [Syntrophales bacterium]|nr:hypothetical protein [Syntrophales bacterium]
MRKNVDLEKVQTKYAALPAPPVNIGGRSWTDRIDTWEKFLSNGETVAEHLKAVRAASSPEDYEIDIRSEAPELHDLLMDIFV